jgi:quinol monooxygenase YgiN
MSGWPTVDGEPRRTAREHHRREGESMSVMVQYVVKVSDVDRFVTTSEKFAPMMEEMGGRNGGVYEDENDPGLVSTISEWESHDQMHEASAKYGDQFNEEAGTVGLQWTTHIWHRKGNA